MGVFDTISKKQAMFGIIRLIRKWQRRIDARCYVNQFLESNNGKKVINDTLPQELDQLKKAARNQLADQWLPSMIDIQDKLNLDIIYQDHTQPVPQSTLLFDDVFRLPYDNYRVHEVDNLIAIQVITALIVSNQECELMNNLLVFITSHESDEFVGMSAYEFKVCRTSDFGDLFNHIPSGMHPENNPVVTT